MKFSTPLISGRLIRRYKRFLADIELDDGRIITAHCANTGAMTGCMPEGGRVWLSVSDNPKRKYAHSWELVELVPGKSSQQRVLACINTAMTNRVVQEALQAQSITELAGFESCQSEVRYGEENSRIDFLLNIDGINTYVEVKHVTLSLETGVMCFPDAVSLRGQKHLRELIQQVKLGHRAVLLFIIMRTDGNLVTPAAEIDAEYAKLLKTAVDEGVEVLAYSTHIDTSGITVNRRLPVKV